MTFSRHPLLDLAGDLARQSGEDDRALQVGVVVFDDQIAGALRHGRTQAPLGRFTVGAAGRAIGGDDLGQAEPGMSGEQLDEALADAARRAEDRHRNLAVLSLVSCTAFSRNSFESSGQLAPFA